MVSVLLCLCMLYNIIIGYTSYWYFVLYLPCAWFVPPLRHCYICVFIHLYVNVIYMVTAICLCTSYNLLLGCAISWKYCHAYLLYIICYEFFTILVNLHSQKWINIYLLELVVTYIEAHIFVPSFSITDTFFRD